LSGFENVNLYNGSLNASLSLLSTGAVGINTGSSATGYPSIAVYSYLYEDEKIVTTIIKEIPEGNPRDLDKPMKPIAPVKP
jgi:hypothetical protein